MTFKELEQKTEAINKEIRKLNFSIEKQKQKISYLRKKYINSNAKFKVGDKVRITVYKPGNDHENYIGYISERIIDTMGKIKYRFNGCEKDGSMSNRALNIFWWDIKITNFKEK